MAPMPTCVVCISSHELLGQLHLRPNLAWPRQILTNFRPLLFSEDSLQLGSVRRLTEPKLTPMCHKWLRSFPSTQNPTHLRPRPSRPTVETATLSRVMSLHPTRYTTHITLDPDP